MRKWLFDTIRGPPRAGTLDYIERASGGASEIVPHLVCIGRVRLRTDASRVRDPDRHFPARIRTRLTGFLLEAALPLTKGRLAMRRSRKSDDWTIERWRTEPRLVGLQFSDRLRDDFRSMWRDVTVASAVAVVLCVAAALVFG
jgi:hypothetical protein